MFMYYDIMKADPKTNKIEKVIVNNKTTIILWDDGTKTISTCDKRDTFDVEKGILAAMCKKAYGSRCFHSKLERALKKVVYQAHESRKTTKTKVTKKPNGVATEFVEKVVRKKKVSE